VGALVGVTSKLGGEEKGGLKIKSEKCEVTLGGKKFRRGGESSNARTPAGLEKRGQNSWRERDSCQKRKL